MLDDQPLPSRDKAMRVLAEVFHPRWNSRDDLHVLTEKAMGHPFNRIAQGMGRGPVQVEQRWHRLRVIPKVEAHLKAYGIDTTPYPEASACDLPPQKAGSQLPRVGRTSV